MISAPRVEEPLALENIAALSRELAADYDPRLRVVGVASTDGPTGRVELVLTIHGCHTDPCVIMLNVTRASREAFEREVREKFRRALEAHVTPM